MVRFSMMFVVMGFLVALGCERKPANQTHGKVTSEDVRRDAGQAVETAAEYSQQTKDEFQKKLELNSPNWMAESPNCVRKATT